jgi:hypothetical protein
MGDVSFSLSLVVDRPGPVVEPDVEPSRLAELALLGLPPGARSRTGEVERVRVLRRVVELADHGEAVRVVLLLQVGVEPGRRPEYARRM